MCIPPLPHTCHMPDISHSYTGVLVSP
jgi:hypothetical protein